MNSAFIERLSGTIRECLTTLTRNSQHIAHQARACSFAMAAVTDHLWHLMDVLSYKVAPAAWIEPKRQGHPKK